MSFNKKNSYSYHAGNRKTKTTLSKSGFTSSSSRSDTDEPVGSTKKNVVAITGCSSPPPQNKTPNKSGLTPVRPTKSPGKLKSGLTPVRSGVSQVTSKSPFSQRPKLKSGLLPIKPIQGGSQQGIELNCSISNAKRKSGLIPMKPVSKFTTPGLLPSCSIQDKTDVSVLEHTSFCFTASRGGMSQMSASHDTVKGRRKSGLLPIKHSLFGAVPPDRQPQWKPRPSMSNSGTRRLPQIRINQPVEATPSLNAITEDSESPYRSNVSGVTALDDSQDMSVVIRPKTGQKMSRIPLPRTTLDNAHFSSDSEITQSRIPKRVLFFPDEDEVRHYPNVLKDASSKANTKEGTSSLANSLQNSDILPAEDKPKPDPSTNKEKREILLQRKKEIQNTMQKMSSELKVIEEQLRTLGEKELLESTNECENLKEDIDESDSPFAQVGSPVFVVPLQHLTLAKSKQPDNMYNCFRESCSFLKTPQHSAFYKPRDSLRLAQQSEDSPNVSQRVQKQLADLFAE